MKFYTIVMEKLCEEKKFLNVKQNKLLKAHI